MNHLKENFWIGFFAGSLWLIVIVILCFPQNKLMNESNGLWVAQLGSEQITLKELEHVSNQELISVKSDEYLILRESLDRWIRERVYVLEARRTGQSREDIEKSIWEKVTVTEDEIQKEYRENILDFQGSPLALVHDSVARELKKRKFNFLEKEWMETVKKRYGLQERLEKPKVVLPNPKRGNQLHPGFTARQNLIQPLAPLVNNSEPVKFDSLEGQPVRGKADAPITIVEFSDFQCPFCQRGANAIEQLMEKNKDKIKVVWFHFPLPIHPLSAKIHEASECAADQQKFWEFYNFAFSPNAVLKSEDDLLKLGTSLKLNEEQYRNCILQGTHREKIAKNIEAAKKVGVQSTPTFFINGKKIIGAQPLEVFQTAVDSELNPKAS